MVGDQELVFVGAGYFVRVPRQVLYELREVKESEHHSADSHNAVTFQ